MISRITKDEVSVITQAQALITLDTMPKPNSIIALLCDSKPKNREQYKWKTRKFHAKLIRTFFLCSLDAAIFFKQSFKLMKINNSSTTCRSVL